MAALTGFLHDVDKLPRIAHNVYRIQNTRCLKRSQRRGIGMVVLIGLFVLAALLINRDRVEEMRSQALDRALLLSVMGNVREPRTRELGC